LTADPHVRDLRWWAESKLGQVYFTVKATQWEFRNRALLFGLIFALTFPLYVLDHRNSAIELAGWLGSRTGLDAQRLLHLVFAFAALLLIVAAGIRTWASAYLHARVVYAADVQTDSLVADGPYRFVRNPLYVANILMTIGIGSMMSRSGCMAAVALMSLFCYRLILREEAALQANQGAGYERYRKIVRRLWPSWVPQIAAAGHQANWGSGFKAELWYWGMTAAITAFAITLNMTLFWVMFGVSMALLWMSSWMLQRKPTSPG
jgi:protein-S-isoprenylcysteine O-methyltransferase Ste14